MTNFNEWLRPARVTDDPAGDFIADARDDPRLPGSLTSLDQLRGYLILRGKSDPRVLAAAAAAWARYRRWRLAPFVPRPAAEIPPRTPAERRKYGRKR